MNTESTNAPRVAAPEALIETEASTFNCDDSSAGAALQPVHVLRNWKGYRVPRSLEAVAQWLRDNPGPGKKPEGAANAPNLVWLATPSENASGAGSVKFSDAAGYDLATTDGLFFDVDGAAAAPEAFEASLEALMAAGYGAIYSRSHNASAADPYRGHVQLVFDSPCPAELHSRVWKTVHDEIFPLVLRSQCSPARGRNALKPGAEAEVFEGALVDWRAVLARAPEESERQRPAAEVAPSCVQLHARDGEVAEGLAALWATSTTGERAFGALGGWLRELGLSEGRALGIAGGVSRIARAVGGHAERRIRQAYAGESTGGFSTLVEALGQNAGGKLGSTRGLPPESAGVLDVLNHPMVVVASELMVLEGLLRDSVSPEVALQELEVRKAEALAADDDAALGAVVREELAIKAKIEESAPAPAAKPAWDADELSPEDFAAPLGPRDWACEPLRIAAGRPVLFSGFGGRGKSWAAEALALSVASGKPVLGVPTAQGSALYLSIEQDKQECRRRLSALCNGAGLDLAGLLATRALRVHTNPPRFSKSERGKAVQNPDAEAWLVEATAGVKLCVVDSLVAMSPGLDGNADEISDSLRMLARVSAKTGCAFVLTAHENKSALERNDAQARETALKGSASLLAASSCIWSFFSEPGASEIRMVNTRCQVGRFQEPQTLTLDLSEMADGLGSARVSILKPTDAEPKPAAPIHPCRAPAEMALPLIESVFKAAHGTSLARKEVESRLRHRIREDARFARLKPKQIVELASEWIDAALDAEWIHTLPRDQLLLARETTEQCREQALHGRILYLLEQHGPQTAAQLRQGTTESQRPRFDAAIAELQASGRIRPAAIKRGGREHAGFERGAAG